MLGCCDNRMKETKYIAINSRKNPLNPDVLIKSREILFPGEDSIVIHVKTASISSLDRYRYHLRNRLNLRHGFTLGLDFSGVVKQTGDGVSKFKIGQRVYGIATLDGSGSFAELITVNQKYVLPIPPGYTDIEAATIPFAAASAYQLINNLLKDEIKPGTRVLINDASREEGYFAAQFAVQKEAYVMACISRESSEEEVLKLKVNDVGEFSKPSLAPKDIDVFIDFSYNKTATAQSILPNVKKSGIVVYMNDDCHDDLVEKYPVKRIKFVLSDLSEELLKVNDLVREGKLVSRVGGMFLFDDYLEALDRESDKAGKDVLVVDRKLYHYDRRITESPSSKSMAGMRSDGFFSKELD